MRETKLILGARDAIKTQRFRLGFLHFYIFFSSPRRVPYAYDTGTAGKLPCPCFLGANSLSKEHNNKFQLKFFVQRIDHINAWVKPACVIRFSCLVNTTC